MLEEYNDSVDKLMPIVEPLPGCDQTFLGQSSEQKKPQITSIEKGVNQVECTFEYPGKSTNQHNVHKAHLSWDKTPDEKFLF